MENKVDHSPYLSSGNHDIYILRRKPSTGLTGETPSESQRKKTYTLTRRLKKVLEELDLQEEFLIADPIIDLGMLRDANHINYSR